MTNPEIEAAIARAVRQLKQIRNWETYQRAHRSASADETEAAAVAAQECCAQLRTYREALACGGTPKF